MISGRRRVRDYSLDRWECEPLHQDNWMEELNYPVIPSSHAVCERKGFGGRLLTSHLKQN